MKKVRATHASRFADFPCTLPADGGSVETPEQAETPKDMFDEVIERRNKRKF